ncbi:hypothetical protein ACE1SV_70010 [Streptomyces sennicomposti]
MPGEASAVHGTAVLIVDSRGQYLLHLRDAHKPIVEFAHAVHLIRRPGGRPRLHMVFRARRWQGGPRVREPDKCLAWRWWPREEPPEPIVPYARVANDGIGMGRLYTERGW